jgi:TRAP-type C4-dicarboxylate transport system permease small subunit
MKKQLDEILGYFLVILMAVMTLDVLWGVLTRYVVGSQASWSEELARFLMIWIGILGAAYASGQRMHLAIDLLQPSLNTDHQRSLSRIISVLVVLFAFTVMVIGGFRLIYITNTLGQLSPALRIPMWVIYSVVPLSGLIIIYYKALDLKQPVLSGTPQPK